MNKIKNLAKKALLFLYKETKKTFKELVIIVIKSVNFLALVFFFCLVLKVFVEISIELKIITPDEIMGIMRGLQPLDEALIIQNILHFGILIMLTTHIFHAIKPLLHIGILEIKKRF